MTKKIAKEILSWILVLVIAVAISQFVTRVIILQVKVPSGSMESTIMIDDKVVAFRLSYWFSDPKRGDIIVFPFPDNEKVDYIKRIIGLPGETVELKNGTVFIDGIALEEDYLNEPINIEEVFGPITVPEDSYFMMGDNRNWSEDSRYWINKFVERDKIRGKALFKYPGFTWFD